MKTHFVIFCLISVSLSAICLCSFTESNPTQNLPAHITQLTQFGQRGDFPTMGNELSSQKSSNAGRMGERALASAGPPTFASGSARRRQKVEILLDKKPDDFRTQGSYLGDAVIPHGFFRQSSLTESHPVDIHGTETLV